MRKSRKFISMPIISIEEGQQIGSVRTLVIDPVQKEIAALVIEQRGWFKDQKIIPYSKVHSVGGDAITVEKNSNAEKQTNLPHIVKLIKDKNELIGSKIVTENGVILGFVDEYYVDLISGKITSLEISGRLLNSLVNGKASLAMENVKTIGKEVIVTFEGSEKKLQQIEAGLKESVKSIRESTSNLWESTVKKTKEITESINNSFEKKKTSPNVADFNETDSPDSLKDEITDITEYRLPEDLGTEGQNSEFSETSEEDVPAEEEAIAVTGAEADAAIEDENTIADGKRDDLNLGVEAETKVIDAEPVKIANVDEVAAEEREPIAK